MTVCGERSAVKQDGNAAVIVSLRCRSWLCQDCHPQRKRQLIAQGVGGQPTTFLTLTSRKREDMTDEEAAKQLSWAWRVLRKRIMRLKKFKTLPFIAIMERHKSGWPHLHLLLRMPFLSQAWISRQMAGLCDGPNVWIEHLWDRKKAAAYCAKYCSKCTQRIGTSKRYWQSRDYDLRKARRGKARDTASSAWVLNDEPLCRMVAAWKRSGHSVVQRSAHFASVVFRWQKMGPAPPGWTRPRALPP